MLQHLIEPDRRSCHAQRVQGLHAMLLVENDVRYKPIERAGLQYDVHN
jgi:hypothetical protein